MARFLGIISQEYQPEKAEDLVESILRLMKLKADH